MRAVCRIGAAMAWTYKFVPAWIPRDSTAEMGTNSGQCLELATILNDVDDRLAGCLPPAIALLEVERPAQRCLDVGNTCDWANFRPVGIIGVCCQWIED